MTRPDARARVLVDASSHDHIDYSAARAVLDLIDDLKQRNVTLVFARASPYLRSDLDRHGITRAVGERWIFTSLHEALAALNLPER